MVKYRKSTRKFRDEISSTWKDSFLIRKICLALNCVLGPRNSVPSKTNRASALWAFLMGRGI